MTATHSRPNLIWVCKTVGVQTRAAIVYPWRGDSLKEPTPSPETRGIEGMTCRAEQVRARPPPLKKNDHRSGHGIALCHAITKVGG